MGLSDHRVSLQGAPPTLLLPPAQGSSPAAVCGWALLTAPCPAARPRNRHVLKTRHLPPGCPKLPLWCLPLTLAGWSAMRNAVVCVHIAESSLRPMARENFCSWVLVQGAGVGTWCVGPWEHTQPGALSHPAGLEPRNCSAANGKLNSACAYWEALSQPRHCCSVWEKMRAAHIMCYYCLYYLRHTSRMAFRLHSPVIGRANVCIQRQGLDSVSDSCQTRCDGWLQPGRVAIAGAYPGAGGWGTGPGRAAALCCSEALLVTATLASAGRMEEEGTASELSKMCSSGDMLKHYGEEGRLRTMKFRFMSAKSVPLPQAKFSQKFN